MRATVLALFTLLATFAAAAQPAQPADTPIATILAYHEVDPLEQAHDTIPRRSATGSAQAESRRYTATPEQFREQLDYLAANGYRVIPLRQLVDTLAGKSTEPIPARAVVITVDDGWLCAATQIAPELKKRNLPWTLFVYPKIVGRGTHAVTWKQVAELARDGVDIQSHSYSHPFLTITNNHTVKADQYNDFLAQELRGSKQELERRLAEARLRRTVDIICYPFGDHDNAVVAAAQTYGYRAGLTTERGVITRSTPVMRLKRYLIHNDTTMADFKTFLLP